MFERGQEGPCVLRLVSVSRILLGGHFLSDTVFAGVFTFLFIWLLYLVICRWKPTRLRDDTIETALESFSAHVRLIVTKFGGQRSD